MSVQDAAVWRAFLDTHAVSFSEVFYDVGLGGKAHRLVTTDGGMRPMWETLLKKRVDAVLVRSDSVWCCEVKPLANMSALGQALSYQFLWNKERTSEQKARAVVVCSRVDLDIEPVFEFYGVTVFVVAGADGSPPAVEKVIGTL